MTDVILLIDQYQKIEGFYPEDLPQDWYLDYYLNEFDALYLTPEIIRQSGGFDELAELLADREEQLTLVLDGIRQKFDLPGHIQQYILKQGFDAQQAFFIDAGKQQDLQKLAKQLQEKYKITKQGSFFVVLVTPCRYQYIKEIETLLNLLF